MPIRQNPTFGSFNSVGYSIQAKATSRIGLAVPLQPDITFGYNPIKLDLLNLTNDLR